MVDAISARVPRPDEFAPARRQLEEEGDPFAFRATSEPLNREEREARSASASALTAGEVAAALADLARLFADAEPATRHPIVQPAPLPPCGSQSTCATAALHPDDSCSRRTHAPRASS